MVVIILMGLIMIHGGFPSSFSFCILTAKLGEKKRKKIKEGKGRKRENRKGKKAKEKRRKEEKRKEFSGQSFKKQSQTNQELGDDVTDGEAGIWRQKSVKAGSERQKSRDRWRSRYLAAKVGFLAAFVT